MATLDVFNNDAFSVLSMTDAVNKLPYVPGQVSRLGIFDEDPVSTTTIMIEEQDGALALVEPTPRGGPGETTDNEKRKVHALAVPHYQRDDAVMADEVQNIRAFGAEDEVETVQAKVDQKMAKHTRALDATLEHQRIGAVKGVVTTKGGKTLVDLYNLFGITVPTSINFALSTSTTKVRQKCFEVINRIEDALDGDMFDHVHALVGREWWKDLIEHKSVKETYLNHVAAAELRGNPNVLRFEFGGIVFERYRTGAKATASLGNPFVGLKEARFFPIGTPGLFKTVFAPADYNETVNTMGLPRYAQQVPKRNNKGVDIEVQSNPLSYCVRPGALLQGTTP